MDCSESRNCVLKALLVCALLLCIGSQQVQAIRPLDVGEDWLLGKFLAIQGLSRGSVPSSGGSACTYIPGKARGRCNLEESSNAGRLRSSPAIPNVESAAASAPAGDS